MRHDDTEVGAEEQAPRRRRAVQVRGGAQGGPTDDGDVPEDGETEQPATVAPAPDGDGAHQQQVLKAMPDRHAADCGIRRREDEDGKREQQREQVDNTEPGRSVSGRSSAESDQAGDNGGCEQAGSCREHRACSDLDAELQQLGTCHQTADPC